MTVKLLRKIADKFKEKGSSCFEKDADKSQIYWEIEDILRRTTNEIIKEKRIEEERLRK